MYMDIKCVFDGKHCVCASGSYMILTVIILVLRERVKSPGSLKTSRKIFEFPLLFMCAIYVSVQGEFIYHQVSDPSPV